MPSTAHNKISIGKGLHTDILHKRLCKHCSMSCGARCTRVQNQQHPGPCLHVFSAGPCKPPCGSFSWRASVSPAFAVYWLTLLHLQAWMLHRRAGRQICKASRPTKITTNIILPSFISCMACITLMLASSQQNLQMPASSIPANLANLQHFSIAPQKGLAATPELQQCCKQQTLLLYKTVPPAA